MAERARYVSDPPRPVNLHEVSCRRLPAVVVIEADGRHVRQVGHPAHDDERVGRTGELDDVGVGHRR